MFHPCKPLEELNAPLVKEMDYSKYLKGSDTLIPFSGREYIAPLNVIYKPSAHNTLNDWQTNARSTFGVICASLGGKLLGNLFNKARRTNYSWLVGLEVLIV